MIFETLELISNELLDIDNLQSRVNNGEFNDILSSHPFLIMTNKGLCLVKKVDNDVKIECNIVVDLSEYIKHDNLNTLVSELITQEFENKILNNDEIVTIDTLKEYAKVSELPTFSFADDGTLSITINGVTNSYSPIVND